MTNTQPQRRTPVPPRPQQPRAKKRFPFALLARGAAVALVLALLVFLVLFCLGYRPVSATNGTLSYRFYGKTVDGSPVQGTLYYADGTRGVIDPVAHTLTRTNGDVYTGALAHGFYDGTGTLIFANGDRYEGEFENGYPCGIGTFTSADGTTVYTGQFRDGLFDGEGTLTLHAADGTLRSTYTGGFAAGMRSGHGTLTRENGDTLQISFVRDLPDGVGIYTAHGESGGVEVTYEAGVRK